MVDSDDAQIDLVGEMRGERMVDMEWEMFEKCLWDRCRDRYDGNTAERKKEKIDFFIAEIGDDEEDQKLVEDFFEGDKDDFTLTWTDNSAEQREQFMDAIIKFYGERW